MRIAIKRTNNLMKKRARLNNEEEDDLQSPNKRNRKAVSKKRNVKKTVKIQGLEKNESKKNVSDKKLRAECLQRSVRIRSRGINAGRILRSTSVQRGFAKQNLRMKKPATQKKLEKPSTSHRNVQTRRKNIKPITEKATTSYGSNIAQKRKTVAPQARDSSTEEVEEEIEVEDEDEEEYQEETEEEEDQDEEDEDEGEDNEEQEEVEEEENDWVGRLRRRDMEGNLTDYFVIQFDKECSGPIFVLLDSSSDSGITED